MIELQRFSLTAHMFQGPLNPKKPRTFRRSMPPKKATFEAACHNIAIGITRMARNTSYKSQDGPVRTLAFSCLSFKWLNSMVYGRYNELVHGGYNGL